MSREVRVKWLRKLFNQLARNDSIPYEWTKSFLMPLYKGRGNRLNCGNYRGMKFMSQTMMMWERVIEGILRTMVKISSN